MIQTVGGDVQVGRRIADDLDAIPLRPDPLGEEPLMILRTSIARRKPSTLSPMPEKVRDLPAFLEVDGRVAAAARSPARARNAPLAGVSTCLSCARPIGSER